MYTYVCQIFVLLPTFLFVRALFGKTASTRTHEARPDTLVEVSARSVHSGARDRRSKFFFPAGVDKTISLVSIREALFRTYVSVNCRLFSSHQVHNRQSQIPSFQRCRPLTVRVRHTHMRNITVARCVSRSLRPSFTICLSRYHILFQTFSRTSPGWRTCIIINHLSPCCFFCCCVLLCVSQQCQCSSCARHSAPTEVGTILYACALSTTVMFVVVIGIGLSMHTPTCCCV